MERRGFTVAPFAVHRATSEAKGQKDLVRRTQILYEGSAPVRVLSGLAAIPTFGARAVTAIGWLFGDMLRVGLHRPAAWKLAWQWLAGARLGRRLRQLGCSHLHVHFAHVPTQIAMYAAAFTGIPFTVAAHANDIFERGLLLPQKARRARKLLTISEFNRAYLMSLGVPASSLGVVRCGVSILPRLSPPGFRHNSRYRVGTLGRLVAKKGMDDVLRAMAQLGSEPWQLELTIVGDGPLLHDLQMLASSLGLGQRVHFEGSLAHSEVPEWLRTLDVFVLACKPDAHGDMDGIPVVLMEAMSQQIPVLSTRLSGIPELVVHERTGLLAAPGDPAALAAELKRLFESPALRATLVQAASAHVQGEFGMEVNLDRLVSFILPSSLGPEGRVQR